MPTIQFYPAQKLISSFLKVNLVLNEQYQAHIGTTDNLYIRIGLMYELPSDLTYTLLMIVY